MQNFTLVFDHVHLISKEPEKAASWYADMLGGEIVAVREVRGAPQCVVAFGGVTILVRGRRPGEDIGEYSGFRWGADHFGFHVTGDFDAFCASLKQKGVAFTVDPVDFNPGLRIAFIEGPDGVVIELLQRK